MKIQSVLLLVLAVMGTWGTVVNSYKDEKGRRFDHHVGSYIIKDSQSNLYRLKYDLEMLGDNAIFNLDQQRDVQKVVCDITNIELEVLFATSEAAVSFFKLVNDVSYDRFVTGTKWNCSDVKHSSKLLMRRVIQAELNNNAVLLHTAQGHYEEAIKQGVISLQKAELPADYSKSFCFGVNANEACDAASMPLPVYESKYISVLCSDCFVGAKATVFVEIEIAWFKLRRVATGFREITVNAAFVLDLIGQVNAAGGVDRNYKLVDQAALLQFSIGPIPISITFDIPLQIIGNARVDAKAAATVGAKANWQVGEVAISWNENDGWKVSKPQPTFSWTPTLKGDADFKGEGMISIIPAFNIYVTRIVQAGLKLTPEVTFQAEGNLEEKQLCADLQYHVAAEAKAEVHINIPLVRIEEDKVFGPYILFDTGLTPIGHWCVPT